MLELRPTCENCHTPLSPDSGEAMICSFECTFCRACVENILHNICPNCGGGFAPRPVRPQTNWKEDNFLGVYPASKIEIHKSVDPAEHEKFSARMKSIDPKER